MPGWWDKVRLYLISTTSTAIPPEILSIFQELNVTALTLIISTGCLLLASCFWLLASGSNQLKKVGCGQFVVMDFRRRPAKVSFQCGPHSVLSLKVLKG